MKKIVCALLAMSFLILSATAAFGYESYITNTRQTCPVYEAILVAGGDMNDPKAAARYEGIPNPFVGGTNGLGKGTYGYEKISEGNYCTRLSASSGAGPYIGHYDSYRITGTIFVEFDFKVDKGKGKFEVGFWGKTPDGGKSVFNTLLFIDENRKLTVPQITNQENYEEYETFPVNEWFKCKAVIDIKHSKCSVFIAPAGKEYVELSLDVPMPGKDSVGYSQFRISYYAITSETSTTSCFVDNLYIKYNVGYNKDLLKKAFLTKIDEPGALARTVEILIDRYNKRVYPMEEEGKRYLSLRFVSDCLRAKLSYDNATGLITINHNDRIISILNGVITVNGNVYSPDAAPRIYENRCYLSVKTLADIFNTNMYYDDKYTLLTDYADVTEQDFNVLTALLEEYL